MKISRMNQIICGVCSLALVAGCATQQEVEKSAPATALECRKDIYDNPNDRSAVLASGGGLSLGASIAIAVASGAMSNAVASGSETRRLRECYDSVGAGPTERLPLTATTKQRDKIVLAGGSVEAADAERVKAERTLVYPGRVGSGGGAGFGNF